jgi:hypothetical protein
VKDLILILLSAKKKSADFICEFDGADRICFIESLDQLNTLFIVSTFVSDCSSSNSIGEGRPGWLSRSIVMDCEVSVCSSRTMMSLLLVERGRFWFGRVRSIIPGLAFRFRAFISLIGRNMVSLIRSMSFLSLGICELVPTPPCGPSVAVRNGGRSRLIIN